MQPATPRPWLNLALVLLLSCGLSGAVTAAQIVGVRWFSGPDHTRIVLDLDTDVAYDVREVGSPPRLAVNLPGLRFGDRTARAVDDGLVRGLRCNQNQRRAQLVVDLEQATGFRHFFLAAESGRPPRVVLDVLRPTATESEPPPANPAPERSTVTTVVLDPGHGGLDPGAVRGRHQEKDIVLDVTRRVASILDSRRGLDVVLTRDSDWYPGLNDRVAAAMAADGDLFVSIHCNTHRQASVDGMEVYFLSLQGATDHEAQELADKENAADLVGLAAEGTADDVVLSILMDLHMSRILYESRRLSDCILGAANDDGVRTRRVKQARFQVLRSLAMPSALVELAYLTNPDDRRLLTTTAGRQTLAETVAAGIVGFLETEELPTVMAAATWSRHYKVRHGDTLWSLSRRHGTTVADIRSHNNLRSDRVQAGQYLSLPEGRPAP